MRRHFKLRCFQCSRWLFIFIPMLLTALPAPAEEYGRYRAIVMHEGGRTGQSGSFSPKVFIIDSKDGHLWTWEQKTQIQSLKGSFELGTVLTYQGRVKPGNKIGEIIEPPAGK